MSLYKRLEKRKRDKTQLEDFLTHLDEAKYCTGRHRPSDNTDIYEWKLSPEQVDFLKENSKTVFDEILSFLHTNGFPTKGYVVWESSVQWYHQENPPEYGSLKKEVAYGGPASQAAAD
jgi:hypothetical protein